MNKNLVMHSDKIQQNLSLNFNINNQNTENFKVISSKIELYDLKFTKNLGITDLTPYFALSIGKDLKKTDIPKERNGHYYAYHEVLEFKKMDDEKISLNLYHKTSLFFKDKFLGGTTIDLTDPNNLNALTIKLFDYLQEPIAVVNIRVRATEILKITKEEEIKRRKFHTENSMVTMQDIHSPGASLDLSNDIVQKINNFDSNSKELSSQKRNWAVKSSMNSTKAFKNILRSQMDYQDSMKKSRRSDDFDLGGETDTLKLEDIQKIKFDLNEEKNKIRLQETHLNKLMRKLKHKEAEIEEEKKNLQKRKDFLTVQERTLLEEKKKWTDEINKSKEERKVFEQEKETIIKEIESVRQNVIITKTKNNILEKKLGEYLQKIIDLKSRTEYINSIDPGEIDFGIQTERQEPKKIESGVFFEGTFAKPRHKKEKSSIFPERQNSHRTKSSDHKKNAKRDNMILQVKLEKNKIIMAEKELLDLLQTEESLLKEIQDRELKRSRCPPLKRLSTASLNSSMASGGQTPHSDKRKSRGLKSHYQEPPLNQAGRIEIPNVSFHQRSHAYSQLPKSKPAVDNSNPSLDSSSSSATYQNESAIKPNQIPPNKNKRTRRPDISKIIHQIHAEQHKE